MTSRVNKHAIWEQRLQEWRKSNLSVKSWCKEQNILYATFCYWKTKLKPQEKVTFEELKEATPTAIELRWGEARLFLRADFDMATLEKFLIALRRAQC